MMKNILTAIFLTLVCAASIRANMAAPSQGGSMSGEPKGLEKIYIRRETLTIDFRGLAEKVSHKLVAVEAVYEIENTDADRNLQLVFALGVNEVNDFNFFLDEAAVETRIASDIKLPVDWKTPLKTPWRDGKEVGYGASSNVRKAAVIDLVIPKGKHILKAQYRATPASFYGYAPQMLYQFAYILAPAREWAGFGGLDLMIYLPEGWTVMIKPEIEQTGEIIQTHFDQIPADALAFTLGKLLPPSYYWLNDALFWIFLASIFAIPIFLIRVFIKQYRRGIINPAMGFLWSLPWAALVGITGFGAFFGVDMLYPTISYGYGGFFSFIFIIIAAAGVYLTGSLLWLVCAAIFGQKKSAK